MNALIVCGAPVAEHARYARLVSSARFVIAADAGADLCLKLDRVPDLFVGDADSVSGRTLALLRDRGVRLVTAPRDKDVSDLDLAFDTARELGIDEVSITAAWGGRADHTIAVVGSLLDAAALRPVLAEPAVFTAWVLAAGARSSVQVEGEGRTVSVLAGAAGARVTVTGARWPLDGAYLAPLSRHGLSNVVAGPAMDIEICEGSALILAEDDTPPHVGG